MNFRALFLHMREMKHYFIAATLTFGLGIYLGAVQSESFLFYLEGQTDHLKGIVEGISRMGHTQLWLLAFIFANNLLVSLMMVYTGFLFGIIPLFALLSNGLLVGFLANQHIPQNGWGTFLLGIVPHGIIEIPAFILACSYGIKLGMLAGKGIMVFPFPNKRTANAQQMLRLLKVSLPLALLMAALLLSAALVESLVTYSLLR